MPLEILSIEDGTTTHSFEQKLSSRVQKIDIIEQVGGIGISEHHSKTRSELTALVQFHNKLLIKQEQEKLMIVDIQTQGNVGLACVCSQKACVIVHSRLFQILLK